MRTMASISERTIAQNEFRKALPTIIDSTVAKVADPALPEVSRWMKKVLDYNMLDIKLRMGFIAPLAYKMIEKQDNISEENLKQSHILGCICEMLQTSFIVIDDIIDSATYRNGVPCWYQVPGVGNRATNDCAMMMGVGYQMLINNFGDKSYFNNLIQQITQSLLSVSIGQHMDYSMGHQEVKDYSRFTKELYKKIVGLKASPAIVTLCVKSAMIMANIKDQQAIAGVENICDALGVFFQVQNDYLDTFCTEAVSGKELGNDIKEGKCSWLAVSALELCNFKQKRLFESCYGSEDPYKIQQILNLYKELRLDEVYKQTEKQINEEISSLIRSLPDSVPPKLFYELLDFYTHQEIMNI